MTSKFNIYDRVGYSVLGMKIHTNNNPDAFKREGIVVRVFSSNNFDKVEVYWSDSDHPIFHKWTQKSTYRSEDLILVKKSKLFEGEVEFDVFI